MTFGRKFLGQDKSLYLRYRLVEMDTVDTTFPNPVKHSDRRLLGSALYAVPVVWPIKGYFIKNHLAESFIIPSRATLRKISKQCLALKDKETH